MNKALEVGWAVVKGLNTSEDELPNGEFIRNGHRLMSPPIQAHQETGRKKSLWDAYSGDAQSQIRPKNPFKREEEPTLSKPGQHNTYETQQPDMDKFKRIRDDAHGPQTYDDKTLAEDSQ